MSWGRARTRSSTPTRSNPSGPRRRSPTRRQSPPGAAVGDPPGSHAGQMGHHDGVLGVGHGHVVGSLVGPDAGLGRLVALEGAVHVEVVGGEVQPGGDGGPEVPTGGQAERGGLDDEHLHSMVVERLDEGDLGVAHRRRPPTGRLEHGGDHHRHRGLAVGAGDGDQRPVVPAGGQVEFGDHRFAQLGGHGEGGVVLGQPGRGQQLVGAGEQPPQIIDPGGGDERHPQRVGEGPLGRRGAVVGGGHRQPPAPEGRHRGPAHDAEAHDHHPARAAPAAAPPAPAVGSPADTQSIPPWARKSA